MTGVEISTITRQAMYDVQIFNTFFCTLVGTCLSGGELSSVCLGFANVGKLGGGSEIWDNRCQQTEKLMNLRDVCGVRLVEVTQDHDDPVNYIPKNTGGFCIGLLAGILLGMPYGFIGASIGAVIGTLAGVFLDRELHAANVAYERRRIGWQDRCDW